jgi:aryl-alcohol dehydrogenase-like predicted oxidoreductase
MSKEGSRLSIGTAQFGLEYGVQNSGKVPIKEVGEILKLAQRHQINTLDTAILYGDSEKVLGEVGIDNWQTISKIPELQGGCKDITKWVFNSIEMSLKRLKINQLYGLLLHHPKDLIGVSGEKLFLALQSCKDLGMVRKIGISIYDTSELDVILPRYNVDIVQSPFNVLDRRLEESGWLERLHSSGTEIHIRSVFLQGLLLMNRGNRPELFNRWDLLWDDWENWLEQNQISSLRACLQFVLSYPEIDRIILGVDSVANLEEILLNINEVNSIPKPNFDCGDDELINPTHWKLSN